MHESVLLLYLPFHDQKAPVYQCTSGTCYEVKSLKKPQPSKTIGLNQQSVLAHRMSINLMVVQAFFSLEWNARALYAIFMNVEILCGITVNNVSYYIKKKSCINSVEYFRFLRVTQSDNKNYAFLDVTSAGWFNLLTFRRNLMPPST